MTQLLRFSPTPDAARLQREFDRLFGSVFPARRTEDEEAQTAVWAPRVDLVESEDAYLVHADLPGIAKDDVAVSFHDGVLTLSGDRSMDELGENDNCVRLERSFGRFYRSFTLPKLVDDKKIEASYQEGVLSVRVPKTEESKPRKISIS